MPGRFAPSPTGPLHVGNLRTALIAWLLARSVGDGFRLRMEDLDRVTSSPEHERAQQADLIAIGVDWDGDVWRQSERFAIYEEALAQLSRDGRTYECFCSRREIREAAVAPHAGDDLVYSGRCRRLTERQRAERRERRPGALRFRADAETVAIDDLVGGHVEGAPWDVVLRRNDGVPAYNLAVVVDDAAAGIDLVVRGDDLLAATPSQVAVGRALGVPTPAYAHVSLVVGADGRRLAKRDGAITLAELAADGVDAAVVRAALATSIGIADVEASAAAAELVDRFDLVALVDACRRPVFVGDLLDLRGRGPARGRGLRGRGTQ